MRLIDSTQLILSASNDKFVTIAEIINAPTIDAVPVVRCKDCKNAIRHCDGMITCQHPCGKKIQMGSNDFCSYGERREEK